MKKKLRKFIESLCNLNEITSKKGGNKPKHVKDQPESNSVRMLNRLWRQSPMCISETSGKKGRPKKSKDTKTNDCLLLTFQV